MSKQTEALKLALENICAAKLCEFNSMSSRHEMIRLMDAAITAIREALAEQPAQGCDYCNHPQYAGTKCKNCGREQPAQQQEPVVVKQIAEALRKHGLTLVKTAHSYHVMDLGRIEAQTTSPQPIKPWVGLTDEEMREVYKRTDWDIVGGWEYERAIEAKLREKNA